jgi:uncharacterized protein (DUF2235 family)
MPKNIVILSDGTGNSAASLAKTNVWRLYRALDFSTDPATGQPRQVAIYRDGVGTSSFRPLALLGGIFGLGLSRNVIELYKFLCRTYEPGDRIYAFGFSRGAFTIRVLVAFALNQGVLQCENEEQLDRYAADAYRAYRRRYKLPLRGSKRDYENSDVAQLQTVGFVDRLRNLRDGGIRLWRWCTRTPQYSTIHHAEVEAIRFIGVWDTVAAYGLPIDELTRGIDEWVWPLSMPNYTLSAKVETARHALALDEERDSFRPLLWDESPEEELAEAGVTQKDRLKQVWFAGVHSNVGGGYADDTLSYVPLAWMSEEAKAAGLLLNDQKLCETYPPANPFGRIYDSRAGIGAYYRYQPRRISSLLLRPKADTLILRDPRRGKRGFLRRVLVHASVLERIEHGRDHYAPISITDRYQVETTSGVAAPPISVSPANAQAPSWQRLWNDVWRRRINYFATVAVSLLVVSFPAFQLLWPPSACVGPQCALSGPINAAGGLLRLSFLLDRRIREGSWRVCRTDRRNSRAAPPQYHVEAAYPRRRSASLVSRPYRNAGLGRPPDPVAADAGWLSATFQYLKWVVAPFAFGVSLLLAVVVVIPSGLYLMTLRGMLADAERSGSICGLGPQTQGAPAGKSARQIGQPSFAGGPAYASARNIAIASFCALRQTGGTGASGLAPGFRERSDALVAPVESPGSALNQRSVVSAGTEDPAA